MIVGIEARTRNRRLGLILAGVFGVLCLGSVAYINWFHANGAGRAGVEAR